MVEFAVILPLLVILVFGITELGRAIYQQNTLSKAIEGGVRYLARSWETVDENCNTVGDWGTHSVNAQNIVVYGNEGGAGDPLIDTLTPAQVSFSVVARVNGTTGEDACVVQGVATTPFDGAFGDQIVPLLDLGAITLNARSEERYVGE